MTVSMFSPILDVTVRTKHQKWPKFTECDLYMARNCKQYTSLRVAQVAPVSIALIWYEHCYTVATCKGSWAESNGILLWSYQPDNRYGSLVLYAILFLYKTNVNNLFYIISYDKPVSCFNPPPLTERENICPTLPFSFYWHPQQQSVPNGLK